LSGYEAPEGSTVNEEVQESQTYDDEAEDTVTGATATPPRPTSSQAEELEDTSTLDSPSLAHAHSTPRAPHTGGKDPSFADYPSPYETLKREMEGTRTPGAEPITPGKGFTLPDISMTGSSPFVPPTSTKKRAVNQDPIFHHVLDKTYRIAATPLTSRKQATTGFTPGTSRRAVPALAKWAEDSSPPSSPAPQLRADIFSSPLKAPRTPGVSVQTPGRGKERFEATQTKGVFDDSDEEDELGFSPPKTIQFHIPQRNVLQTPAREASKRIVEDLLLTAGGDITDDTGGFDEEDSPSVVRRQVDLDDSF
jgi:DASH complex subunit ASK1